MTDNKPAINLNNERRMSLCSGKASLHVKGEIAGPFLEIWNCFDDTVVIKE